MDIEEGQEENKADEEVLCNMRQIWPGKTDEDLMDIHNNRKRSRSKPISVPVVDTDPLAQPEATKKAKVHVAPPHHQAPAGSASGSSPHIPSPCVALVPSPVLPIRSSLKSKIGTAPIKKTKAVPKHKYTKDETRETRKAADTSPAPLALCLVAPAKEKILSASDTSRQLKRSHQDEKTVARSVLRSSKKSKDDINSSK